MPHNRRLTFVRYLITFLTGAAVGAAVLLFLLKRTEVGYIVPTADAVRAAGPAGDVTATVVPSAEVPLTTTPAAALPDHPLVTATSSTPLTAEMVVIPVAGVKKESLHDMFHESRGGREHHAIDIMATRGTPVLAAIDGTVAKLFLSKPGGITIYEYDPAKQWIYYYAHLERYADGLVEEKPLKRGDVIGYVGTTGNAPPDAPHLHFAIEKLQTPGVWWKSDPIDPYPILVNQGITLPKP